MRDLIANGKMTPSFVHFLPTLLHDDYRCNADDVVTMLYETSSFQSPDVKRHALDFVSYHDGFSTISEEAEVLFSRVKAMKVEFTNGAATT